VREFMRKGTWAFMTSDQPTGSLEDWATYLFDEAKPYTIEECMDAVLLNDLNPFIIRNRWDVGIEGDMLLNIKYLESGQLMGAGTPKPAMEQRDEAAAEGIIVTKCPTCQTVNEFDLTQNSVKCFVCGAIIPRPVSSSWLKEIARPLQVNAE
ncbi:MAG: hypothetical protein LUO93_10500, partial [Methanomicrobiales archaeon]|nr:hypothetical protein [Methanomicrobiales archaeon]